MLITKGNVLALQWRNMTDTTLSKRSKLTSPVTKTTTSRASEYDREECVTFVVFLPQMHNANLKKEENTREPN